MKPGLLTSEFLLVVIVGAIYLANGTSFVNVPWSQLEWLSGLAGAYVLGRSLPKAAEAFSKGKTNVP